MPYLLGIEACTTWLTAVLFNETGEPMAKAHERYNPIYPEPGRVEISPERYWSACIGSIRQILAETRIDPREILSLGVSSQGETFIPVDHRGEPLRRAIVWLDDRPVDECRTIQERFGTDEVFRITGQCQILPMWTAAKILWLRRNEPQVFRETYKYLFVEDYLIYKLARVFATEYSVTSSSLMLHISRKEWWSEMLETIGIDEDQLADQRPSGEPVGTVSEQASSETGLSSETVVSTGAFYHAAIAVGAGNIESGIVTEKSDAGMTLVATTDDPICDTKRRVSSYVHAVKDKYFLFPWGRVAGFMLGWFRDNFCQAEVELTRKLGIDVYSILDMEASKVSPGSGGLVVLPHLMGAGCPEFDFDARGVVFGLTQNHTKGHFIRGIMEAVAYMLRRNVDLLEELNVNIEKIVSIHTPARSDLWRQIKADVTQKPVVAMECENNSCLGAAILSGKAEGLFKTVQEGVDSMVQIRSIQEPRLRFRETYFELFSTYTKLFDSLVPLFKEARNIRPQFRDV